MGERALSSTDKRQITRLSSCHLRNRKKPFRVSLDSGRRTPDVLWISFFLSQKSRKLGRVKSSFHGPRGHTEGEQRMNAASKIRSARLWFGSVLHTWSYYLFPEKSAFPPSFASSFREQSLTFAAIFFKVMGKTRRNRNPRNHRCNLVEPGRLYRVRSIWKSKQATGNCITSWEVITSESCSISIKKKKEKSFLHFLFALHYLTDLHLQGTIRKKKKETRRDRKFDFAEYFHSNRLNSFEDTRFEIGSRIG